MKNFFLLVCLLLLISFNFYGDDGKATKLGLAPTSENLLASFRLAGCQVYEGNKPDLSSGVDLSPNFPSPGYQGQIGSCTAWATGYALKSFQKDNERNWGLSKNTHIFSPSFIYNQINGGVDQGAS